MTEKENLGRGRLEEAFRRYDLYFYDSFPEEKGPFTHTQGFEQRMHGLLFDGQATSRKSDSRSVKRGLFFLIAAVLMLASVMGASAVKRGANDFLLQSHGGFMELIGRDEAVSSAPAYLECVYLPTVPQSLRTERTHVTAYEAKHIFVDEESGVRVIFTQLLLDAKSTMDSENANLEIRYVDDLRVAFSEKNGLKSFYWSTPSYSFSLVVQGNMSEKMCLDMIGSVSPVQTP